MVDKKQNSFADLNFDNIIASDAYQNTKVVSKTRLSNSIKCILFALGGIGLGCGLFAILFYFCR